MIKVQVIIGTTRQGRFSEKAALWIYEEVKKKEGVEVELVDLRDYPLPFFNETVTPSVLAAGGGGYSNEMVKKWTEKIGEADGYVIVTGEYNHGYPAVLKNALDYVYKEWQRKAVGFVSYGSALGARAVEQLRQVVIELQMVPIRSAIQIPPQIFTAIREQAGQVNPELFKPLREGRVDKVEAFLNDLVWMTQALKAARVG